MADPQPFADVQLALTDAAGRVDVSPGGILSRRLAVYQGRLARVRARGGPYAKVEFSDYVQDLLARLEAGKDLSRAVH